MTRSRDTHSLVTKLCTHQEETGARGPGTFPSVRVEGAFEWPWAEGDSNHHRPSGEGPPSGRYPALPKLTAPSSEAETFL